MTVAFMVFCFFLTKTNARRPRGGEKPADLDPGDVEAELDSLGGRQRRAGGGRQPCGRTLIVTNESCLSPAPTPHPLSRPNS
jgi:hypothetical protein